MSETKHLRLTLTVTFSLKSLKSVKSHLKNSKVKSITFDQYSVGAVELWMRGLHRALTPNLDNLPLLDIWNPIAFARHSEFNMNDLKQSSDKYLGSISWHRLDFDDLRQLFYPCFAFNHARAFAIASRRLSLQGAAMLRSSAARHVFRIFTFPPEPLIGSTPPKATCEAEFYKLCSTPLSLRNSAKRIALQETTASPHTLKRYKQQASGDHVDKIRERTITYWEGLCLDCMDLSQPKTASAHGDYFSHNILNEWSRGCRTRHHRNTWYHSFMGRPDIMDKYQKDQDERNKQERMASQGSYKTRTRNGW
ncbi:hypothetical protein BDZ45DRAFT_734865 [Acephala macrosclerotiorum]|nr:hypothetical protein BDZ45DRAFT_734865 [Acephala macrosclerotiorum]